jgi:hypothetical protein
MPALTATKTTVPTATYTNTPVPTAANTNVPTATAVGTTGPRTVTFTVRSATDDVNEDGANFVTSDTTIWIGSGANPSASFAGLRFTGVTIPRGATITSAHLEFYSTRSQWIPLNVQMAADAADNSLAFTTSSKPSGRPLTTARITHNTNINWAANTWYSLDDIRPVIQEVVSRAGWQSGNSISLILKGLATGAYSRKYASSFEGNATLSVRLVISYTP